MMAAVASVAMTLGELLGPQAGALGTVAITDLVADSREVVPGAAFVALPGARHHGLDFAADALARGAAVVLYEPSSATAEVPERSLAVPALTAQLGDLAQAFYGHGRAAMRLVAVTGTNGKSTVAYLTAAARSALGTRCGYLGTLGYGVPPTLERQALTTPDCLTLHRHLRALDVREAALEVSSHAIAQQRIAGLRFETAVFTNLTRDHLDYHGDLASYQATKARLFALDGLAHAVIFIDDAFGKTLAASLRRDVELLSVSLAGDAEIVGRIVASDFSGMTVEARTPSGAATIQSRLIGDVNAENLLLALGALLTLETPVEDACAALSCLDGLPGRLQLFGGGSQPWVVVDYAHTPDALERVLGTLRRQAEGALWCVFGCGGDRDTGKRPEMGAAASIADHIVITDDNPRHEDPAAIVAGIRAGIARGKAVIVEHDRRAAIALALARAVAGDVVLIAGRGHETQQLIGGHSVPLDDREVVTAILGAVS